MKLFVVLIVLVGSQWLSAGQLWAQGQPIILGRVLDGATNQPLPFATVYINSSTRGTTADGDGNYRLTGVPPGTVELVASSVGYKPGRQLIRFGDDKNHRVTFFLTPDTKSLQAITVTAKRSKAYSRMLKQFKRDLLGNTAFAERCVITNIETVALTITEGRLEAQATEPLVVENQALGYRLYYDMTHFDSFRQATHYGGTSRFEVLTPTNAEQAERWERSRQKAYQGSIRHLIASLLAGTYEQEGFLVYKANFDVPADPSAPIAQLNGIRPTAFAQKDSLFKPAQLPLERQFFSRTPLEIFYTRQRVVSTPYRDLPYAYSILYMPKTSAIVTTDGWVVQPNGMEVLGAMSDDRLATLLPADWKPTGEAAKALAVTPDEGVVLPPDTIVASLAAQWSSQQKSAGPAVFVHIDKSVYATGDQLWFSGYVLDPATHQPSLNTSSDQEIPVHIDLIAPNGQLIQHQWARVKEGRTTGSFRLSDSLTTGVYRLRAYTETDKANTRPAFERTIPIINNLIAVKPIAPAVTTDSLDVQFLPEGGRWVAGLPSRVGIKAVNRQGKGLAVTGSIRSKQGAELGQFATNELGIGSVDLLPLANQVYVAGIQTATGRIAIPLPAVDTSGLVLATDMVSDSMQLIIHVRASAQLARQPVYLTVQNGGQLVQQTKLQLQAGKGRLSIPAAKLPVGITQVTLANAQGIPQAERLVFIPDRVSPVQTNIITDKTTYQPRESVTMALRVADGFGDPLSIIGSVSVTDVTQLPADTTVADIRTHLLLTGELRGTVEHPNTYLSSNQPSVRRALDDLLLTQGWRRINWRVNPVQSALINPPVSGIVVRGRVLDKKNQAVPDANVLMTLIGRSSESFARSARTDQQGNFLIDKLLVTDTVTVRSRVMTASFKPIPSARVLLAAPGGYFRSADSVVTVDLTGLGPFVTAMQQRQASAPDQYRDRDARLLKEVVVRAAKPDDDSQARRVSLHSEADATILFDEKARAYSTVYEMLQGRVAGVQVNGTSIIIHGVGSFSSVNSVPLFLLDGQYVPDLSAINPSDVERIEVIKNGGAAMYGARGGAGVVAVFTKKAKFTNTKTGAPNESISTLYGYPTEREFYTPRYGSSPDEPMVQADRRDVLYWKPILATDGKGVTTFRFPLSDIVHTVRITLQGVTTYGRPIYVDRLLKVR